MKSHRRGGAGETGGRGGTRRGSVVARAKTRVRTWLMVETSTFRPEVSRGSLRVVVRAERWAHAF